VIEEELNEVRNEQSEVWENTKHHLKLAKRNSGMYNLEMLTMGHTLYTEREGRNSD